MDVSRRKLLSCMVAGSLSVPFTGWAVPSVLDLVYFHNYPPYSWDDGVRMRGLLIDVLTYALEDRMNIRTSHTGYPWTRAQHLVEINAADAFCTVPTADRRRYTEISEEPVLTAEVRIFTNRSSPNREALTTVTGLDDLRGFRLGLYHGSGWAKENLKGRVPDLFEAATLDSALAMLAANRVDAIVESSQVMRYRILQLELNEVLEELPPVLDQTTFNLCISKQSPYVGILPSFDNVIRDMRETGTLNALLSRYG